MKSAENEVERALEKIKSSVQAIKLSGLSSVSQDVAIGIIVATVLLHDEKGQEKLIR